jgi:CheY-like chemotaxis protein
MSGPRTILIVEHSPIQAARLEAFLQKHGFCTVIATGVAQALEKLGQCAPDLVVAGADLPGENGTCLCNALAESPRPTAVIVFADQPGSGGAAGFVAKSDGLPALLVRVQATLSGEDAPARPLTVLAADDNRVNLMLAEWALNRAGYHAVAVDSGEKAIRQAQERAFDLILMDVQMPDIDGAEAARRIRAGGGPSKDAPILALTGHSQEELASLGIEIFDGYVPKPFDLEAFKSLAATVLAKRGG